MDHTTFIIQQVVVPCLLIVACLGTPHPGPYGDMPAIEPVHTDEFGLMKRDRNGNVLTVLEIKFVTTK